MLEGFVGFAQPEGVAINAMPKSCAVVSVQAKQRLGQFVSLTDCAC